MAYAKHREQNNNVWPLILFIKHKTGEHEESRMTSCRRFSTEVQRAMEDESTNNPSMSFKESSWKCIYLQSTNCTFLLASHSLLNAHSGYSTNHIKLFNFFSFLHINMNRSLCKTGCWLLLAQMFCKIVCNPFRKRPKCVLSPSLGLGLDSWWCAFGLVFFYQALLLPLCVFMLWSYTDLQYCFTRTRPGLVSEACPTCTQRWAQAMSSLRSLSHLYPEVGSRPCLVSEVSPTCTQRSAQGYVLSHKSDLPVPKGGHKAMTKLRSLSYLYPEVGTRLCLVSEVWPTCT